MAQLKAAATEKKPPQWYLTFSSQFHALYCFMRKQLCVYAAFDPYGRNFGRLFGFSVDRYSYFHFSSGWPKFRPGFWSIHYSSTYISFFLWVWPKFRAAFPIFVHISNCFPFERNWSKCRPPCNGHCS